MCIDINKLRPGDIVRHKSGSEGYIVTDNYGYFAIAVRTIHISNPNEWVLVSSNAAQQGVAPDADSGAVGNLDESYWKKLNKRR
jgi:hypothetical protein